LGSKESKLNLKYFEKCHIMILIFRLTGI